MRLKLACPENARLKHFLSGQTSTVETATVQVHLGNCEVCRAIVAGLMATGTDGNTFNDEIAGEVPENNHTCQIDAPSLDSTTIGAAADEPAPAVNHDHTCQIEASNHDATDDADHSLVERTGSEDDASLVDTDDDHSSQIIPPGLDAGTMADASNDASDASVLLSGEISGPAPSVPKDDQTCQFDASAHDLGTIGDAPESSVAAPAAKSDSTSVLPGKRPDGGNTKSIEPTRMAPPPSSKKSDETCNLEPEGAAVRLEVKGASPSLERMLKGVTVPGYDILEELGRGGMGVVYKARHRRLQRLVALKMVLAGAHLGKMGLARFRAEAEAIAQLPHANIVQIYETGEHDGHPYFSLEYVEGGSLDQRMKESPTTPQAAAQLVETLARTMDIAHQRGIVHRDLKPANILLATLSGKSSVMRKDQTSSATLPLEHWSRTTVPKITDFGLAKRMDDESGQTHTGTILGTPSYMAPEQAGGKTREVGPAADTYALGAILYELLTGRPPFKAGNPIDTIRQVIEQEPVPPRQLEPRVPHDLETICLKCLEKEPARRFASAAELADELHRFLEGEPIHARPTPAWERAWKWGKRRPAIVALLGVSLLAIVGMVSFIVWYNFSLSSQLVAAREEGSELKQREQDALEEKRLSRMETDGQKLYDSARIAVGAGDWASARVHLTNALATVGSEPRLAAVRDPAQTLLVQVEEELRVEADRRASQAKFEKFVRLSNEAQFLGSMYTGMDLATNLKAARITVNKALATYAVTVDGDGKPALDAYLKEPQKAEILADCYQLLLILAETEALSAQDQAAPANEKHLREALRILDRATAFGAPSKAYHLRRARYLTQLGDKSGAAQAEKAARGAAVVDVFDHFLMADEYYRRANYEAASKEFEQVLQRKPNHFWAQYLNGLCLSRQERYAEARAQFSASIAQRTDFIWLYLLRGFAHIELKAWDGAEDDFKEAQRLAVDDYSRYVLHVHRAVLRLRQDRCNDAIVDLNAAIKLKPRETTAFINLAQVYRQLKDLELAVKQIDHALGIEPENAHLYRLRARLQVERKEPVLALQDFDRAIQREAKDSPMFVGDHVERGRLLLRDRKHAEALASFDAALRLRKDHSLGQRLRAEALFHLGRYQDVVDAFDQYLETGGKPLESVYRGRGLARSELGKYPGAIEDFTKALELQPTSAVQAYRGWMHLVVEAPKLALRDFELAVELDPKNGDAHNGRGFVRATLGQHTDALKDAREAVRLGPASPRLLYNSARIHAQCPGAANRAIDLIVEALGLLPAEQRPAFWVAYIQTDRALESIRRYPRFVQMEKELQLRK